MQFELSSLFHPRALGILLALCLLVFGALSVAFIYHWREYGMNTRLIRLAPTLYLLVSVSFCALAIISYLALISY
ncbi:MAG: hypothetical protein Q7R93_00790 [bacterium]|nr:hypothetical protein [bacterium]